MTQAKTSRIQRLLAWCAENGIQIDERLSVVELDASADGPSGLHTSPGSITVFATGYIPPLQVVVKIPKTTVLSIKTCAMAAHIQDLITSVSEEREPNMWLSLAVLTEKLLGDRSRWSGYLQSFPTSTVPLAAFWESTLGEDGRRAKEWCRGTEVEKLICRDELEAELNVFYDDVAFPFLRSISLEGTFEDLQYSYSLVSSRAFHVDSYHGIAMVPIADAFNHTEENHVHFESDYHVCPTCGSFDECEHDGEDRPSNLTASTDRVVISRSTIGDDDMGDMVTNSDVFPGDEVFNSYDSSLSNAQLLCQYGFLLEGNSNDIITWSLADLWGILGRPKGLTTQAIHACSQVITDQSLSLAYDSSEESKGEATLLLLAVNAEGLISSDLLAFLVVKNLVTQHPSLEDDILDEWLVTSSNEVARSLEQLADESDAEMGGQSVDPSMAVNSGTNTRIISDICFDVATLCKKRIEGIGAEDVEKTANWGEILDATPLDWQCTRMAISHAMSERSILESCRLLWEGIAARNS